MIFSFRIFLDFLDFFLPEKSGYFRQIFFFSFILKHSRRLGDKNDIIPFIFFFVNRAIKFYLWETMK